LADGNQIDLKIPDQSGELSAQHSDEITLGLRPEAFGSGKVSHAQNPDAARFICHVDVTEPTGPDLLAMLTLSGTEVTTRLPAGADIQAGQQGDFSVDMSKAIFFDAGSGNRI